MKYDIRLTKSANEDLLSLPKIQMAKVYGKIEALSIEPRPAGCKKLKGFDEALWRIRVGDYRVIYVIEDSIKVLEVRKIGHRKEIYE